MERINTNNNPETIELAEGVLLEHHDREIDEKAVKFTVVKAQDTRGARIVTDELFKEKGIVTEPGSMLISQPGTTELFGRPAGEKPEDYIEDMDNVLAIGGNHYGWQKGAFIIEDGSLELIENDKGELTGDFPVLAMDETGAWSVRTVPVEHGEPVADLSDIELGMNGAQIVRDGVSVSVAELLDDPRIRADMRNLVDFSNGNKVPGEFFQDVRGFSPEVSEGTPYNRDAFRRMLMGKKAVFRAEVPEDADIRASYDRFAESAADVTDGALQADDHTGSYRLGVMQPLPEQRMPLVGFGSNQDGELIVVAVDGRQPGTAGASIRQLAELMVESGVTDGILGCGGGDVSVVEKRDGRVTLHNSPANVDAEGNRVTRRVPNVLVLPLEK